MADKPVILALRKRRKALDRAIQALEEFQKLSASGRLTRAAARSIGKVVPFSRQRDLRRRPQS